MSFLKHIPDFIFQKRCIYCRKTYASKAFLDRNIDEIFALCPDCALLLERKKAGYCLKCGALQDKSLEDVVLKSCPLCEEKEVLWDDLRFYSSYDSILQDIIRYAKFYNKLLYTKTLADLLLPLINEFDTFDMLIPIPMHEKKLRERGYNQCNEIVKHIAKISTINIDYKSLHKDKITLPQASLSKEKRIKNLQNAFSADTATIKGKTIVLLDDVSTTGSTLREATKALKKAGAKKVYIVYAAGAALHSI